MQMTLLLLILSLDSGKALSVWWGERREAGAFKLALGKTAYVNDLLVLVWK